MNQLKTNLKKIKDENTQNPDTINHFLIGFLLMLLGCSLLGNFSFPVKFNKKWAGENTWAAGSLMALLLVSWPV